MKHATLTCLIFLLAAAAFGQGARIEDLQDLLQGLGKEFQQDASFDQEIAAIRNRITEAGDPAEKRQLFKEWKGMLAKRIRAQDDLSAKLSEALATAQGLPSESTVNATDVMATFEARMESFDGQLEALEAMSVAMMGNNERAELYSKLINRQLQVQRMAMDQVRQRMRELASRDSGSTTSGELVTTLQAMNMIARSRELSRNFEFALATQMSDMSDLMGDVNALFKELLNGDDMRSFMRNTARSEAEAATQMEEMMDAFVNTSSPIPVPTAEEVEQTMQEMEEFEHLLPYQAGGHKYYFDFDQNRWYTRDSKNQRIYLPGDPETGNTKFIRVQNDGNIYSEVPGNQPLRIMPIDDWIKSVNQPAPLADETGATGSTD